MVSHLTIALIAVFASVALATGMIASHVLSMRVPERRRLREMIRPRVVEEHAEASLLVDTPNRFAGHLDRWVPRWPARLRHIRPRLEALGYRSTSAVVLFAALELLVAAASAMFVVVFWASDSWALAILVGAIGYFIPSVLLNRRFRRRQTMIQNGLPDALDLCVICLEAGCSLDHAISKTSDELALAYPELAEELSLVRAETRAGKPKMEAFKNLAERTQLEDVRSLVGMLVQTERFGTSISQALRTHAEVSRNKRRQRAEERAAKAGVKLVFPLVCCLFPAFYVVTLGPAILQFVRVFSEEVMPAFK